MQNNAPIPDLHKGVRICQKHYFNASTGHHLDSGEIPTSSFSREALREAHVVAQVDCKFIACVVSSGLEGEVGGIINTSEKKRDPDDKARASLVLIDQHAADERIRVERYLKSICLGFLDNEGAGVGKRLLDPPVPVLLTRAERDQLLGSGKLKRAFSDWGLSVCDDFGNPEDGSDNGYGMARFRSVPEVVADKVR